MKKATSVAEQGRENVSRIRSYADVAFGPRQRVVTVLPGVSRTKQSFKDECDINILMRRYQQSGVLPPMDGREPRYMDCSSVDYQEAMLIVANARSAFQDMSAELRDRFKNNPQMLLEFLEDPKNREEAVKLGLVNPPKGDAKPIDVRVVAPDVPVGDAPVASAPPPAKQK